MSRVLPSIEGESQLARHLLQEHGVAAWLTTDSSDLEPGGRLFNYIVQQRMHQGVPVHLPDRFDYLSVNNGQRKNIEDLLHDEENDSHFGSLAELHDAYHQGNWGDISEQCLGAVHTHSTSVTSSWNTRYKNRLGQ